MTKIVINRCYGGFGLSPAATRRLAELEGKPCYFFTMDYQTHKYKAMDDEGQNRSGIWNAFTVPNPTEVAGSQEDWYNMTQDERRASNERWSEISLDNRPGNRSDPLLVSVVEELGEAANGAYAGLAVVEVPDDVEWEIEEYDGKEWVSERHQRWE